MKKTKTTIRNILTLVVICALMLGTTSTAFAAGFQYDQPYGYIWTDTASGFTHIQFYKLGNENHFITADGVELRGSVLYAEGTEGRVLMSNIATMADLKRPTVAVDRSGRFYAIATNGTVRRFDNTKVTTYNETEAIKATSFVMDDDDLVIQVLSADGKVTAIGDLVFTTTRNIGDDSPIVNPGPVAGCKVMTRARGDGGVIYDAYKNGVLLLSVHTFNANVWLQQANKLLSGTCVGSKFVGYSRQYAIILLNQDGVLFAFANDGKYENPKAVSIQEKIIAYDRDESGFIYSVRTANATYLLDKLFDEVVYDKVTKVVNSTKTGSISYSGEKVMGTLSLANGMLSWNGNQLPNSSNPTYFGITAKNIPVWISVGDLYAFDGRNICCLKRNVTNLSYASNGVADSVYIGTTQIKLDTLI